MLPGGSSAVQLAEFTTAKLAVDAGTAVKNKQAPSKLSLDTSDSYFMKPCDGRKLCRTPALAVPLLGELIERLAELFRRIVKRDRGPDLQFFELSRTTHRKG